MQEMRDWRPESSESSSMSIVGKGRSDEKCIFLIHSRNEGILFSSLDPIHLPMGESLISLESFWGVNGEAKDREARGEDEDDEVGDFFREGEGEGDVGVVAILVSMDCHSSEKLPSEDSLIKKRSGMH